MKLKVDTIARCSAQINNSLPLTPTLPLIIAVNMGEAVC